MRARIILAGALPLLNRLAVTLVVLLLFAGISTVFRAPVIRAAHSFVHRLDMILESR